LLDADGHELPPGGSALARLDRIDSSGRHPALVESAFSVACDVTNPLCGPLGASRVFGPQKGADEAAVEQLDAALRRFGEVVARDLGVPVLDVACAGAAGGLGAGLMALCRARLMPGAEVVAQACRLEQQMAGADLVVTGEGRIDSQTAAGKTPLGVARIAKKLGIPVVAVAGALGAGYEILYELGIDAIFPIQTRKMTLAESIACCEDSLQRTGGNLARLLLALNNRQAQ